MYVEGLHIDMKEKEKEKKEKSASNSNLAIKWSTTPLLFSLDDFFL